MPAPRSARCIACSSEVISSMSFHERNGLCVLRPAPSIHEPEQQNPVSAVMGALFGSSGGSLPSKVVLGASAGATGEISKSHLIRMLNVFERFYVCLESLKRANHRIIGGLGTINDGSAGSEYQPAQPLAFVTERLPQGLLTPLNGPQRKEWQCDQ